MPLLKNKYFPYLLLLLLAIPLFFLNIRDVHPWGDDFAQYIKEALNFAHGKPFYQSAYVYNPHNTEYAPPQYPPGYPLLLAPVVKIWGLAIRPMLYLNSVIAAALLFALFAYFRKQVSLVTALCLSVAITYSGIMIYLKGNVLSDVPCLLFVVLYLTVRNAKSFPVWRISLLVFLLVAAMLIRSQAILLLVAEALYLLLSFIRASIKEKKIAVRELYAPPSLYIIAGGLLINLILNKFVFVTPVSTSLFYGRFVQQILDNDTDYMPSSDITRMFTNLSAFFYYETHITIHKAAVFLMQRMGMIFGLTGFAICLSKRISVDDLFFALMCLMVVFLPVYDDRYFLPTIPIVFFYCFVTFKTVLPAITKIDGRYVGVFVTLVFLRLGFGYLHRSATQVPAGCIPQQRDLTAFSYISQHVNDSDIIIFAKPRALALYTNKRSVINAWRQPLDVNARIFDSLNVKYLLTVDGMGADYFKGYMREFKHPIDSLKIADGYTLYTLR